MERFLEKCEDKVFEFLFTEGKITQDVINNIRNWKHSGFSVDNSVHIHKDDKDGMRRLIEYIARCPFSLTRFIKLTKDGKVLYRAVKPSCLPFPTPGNENLEAGMKRNFVVFEPLDFLAEVVQHISKQQKTYIYSFSCFLSFYIVEYCFLYLFIPF